MPFASPYFNRVLRAILIGLPGIAALALIVPAPEGIPHAAIVANPLILLVLAALAGAWAAPRAGLGSAILLGVPVQIRALLLWLAAAVALGAIVAIADHAFAPIWQAGGLATLRESRDVTDLALGLFYGGLTEEVLLRWGLMTLLAVGLMKLLPRPLAVWIASILAAFVFAAAHIPAVMIEAGILTPGLLARTLIWNGLLGIAFGAAFLRHGLEAAILAHMGVHLGFAVTAI